MVKQIYAGALLFLFLFYGWLGYTLCTPTVSFDLPTPVAVERGVLPYA